MHRFDPLDPPIEPGLARTLAEAALLAFAIAIVYMHTLAAPFVFDDFAAIVENPTIRRGATFAEALSPPANTGVSGRPLVNLSLAINHSVGELDPRGYHAVNVIFHWLAALTLLGLTRRTFQMAVVRGHVQSTSLRTAFLATLLWAVHPLLTESVTCIVQRNELLVGLFYLLTLYAFSRSVAPGVRWSGYWRIGSVAACWAGMASKEVMVSAPLIVLLYDRTFAGGSFRAAWQQRRWYYVGLASSWALLVVLILGAHERGGTVGFGLGIGAWEYLLTQCRALAIYSGLAVWPHPLVLDYGRPIVSRLGEVVPQAVVLVALFGGAIVALQRRPALGFAGIMLFALLAPSSSFVPLTTQTIAEHRMYLPLAVLAALALCALHRLTGRHGLACAILAGCGYGGISMARNADYASELRLWNDTVAKAPLNARAHNNLGLALLHAGRAAAAREHYREALRLDPAYSPAHANLADTLAANGELAAALLHYETALRISPDMPVVQHRHGIALLKAGRVAEAMTRFEAALRLRPDYAEAHNNLGTALLALGRAGEARARFEHALQIEPEYELARRNLARLDALERREAR